MVVIFCDASYNEKTLKCGCGIIIKEIIPNGLKETRINVSDYAVDNNDAELKAVLHGLEYIDKHSNETLNVVTDSQVAINELKKAVYHTNSNVTDINPKYRETIKSIVHKLAGKRLKLYHCKGHSNRQQKYSQIQAVCDKLAKKSRC